MKIALVTNIPAPYRIPIYEKLSSKLGENFIVFFCAKSEPNRQWKEQILNFKHKFLKENIITNNNSNFIHNNIEIFQELKKFKPDIVITTGFNPTYLYAWFYTILYKTKHIPMTDGWIESEKNLSIVHKIIRKIVYFSSNAFIGASKNSLELYKSYGISNDKLFQSHLCIENTRFLNFNSFDDRYYDLMFSGQFIERKMPLFFADVVCEISKQYPDIKILILGDGPLKKIFLEKLDKYKVNYEYAGFVSQEDLPSYYGNSKLFLFPTLNDPWGVVVNEAMASKVPVITTLKAGVINDLLINNYNGYILDVDINIWKNKIIEILSDKLLWGQLSENALKQVDDFNHDVAMSGIYDAAISVMNTDSLIR